MPKRKPTTAPGEHERCCSAYQLYGSTHKMASIMALGNGCTEAGLRAATESDPGCDEQELHEPATSAAAAARADVIPVHNTTTSTVAIGTHPPDPWQPAATAPGWSTGTKSRRSSISSSPGSSCSVMTGTLGQAQMLRDGGGSGGDEDSGQQTKSAFPWIVASTTSSAVVAPVKNPVSACPPEAPVCATPHAHENYATRGGRDELAQDSKLPVSSAPSKGAVDHQAYIGNSSMPTSGWFQVCRRCRVWTGSSIELDDEREVPLCRRCQSKLQDQARGAGLQAGERPDAASLRDAVKGLVERALSRGKRPRAPPSCTLAPPVTPPLGNSPASALG
mmetsp:Transcript_26494/g.68083  ORF Transcript_26494/g.68083 Transcript_26494/m.68083 type:complete len:334 (-) Transcript_26494:378-1379(-)